MIQESQTIQEKKRKSSTQLTRSWQLYETVTFANLSSNMYMAKLLYMYARWKTNNHMLPLFQPYTTHKLYNKDKFINYVSYATYLLTFIYCYGKNLI